ncbi:MAG: Choline dehydrogenase-like flavoprotein [Myxococcales bacterium]|nr:Choline dehydrogenase-like flavoprotein [Myxococcales bacterium]
MRKTVYGNTSLTHFDACVIGSGAGGGPMAYVLAANGLKVLVLEAGPCHLDFIDDPAQQPIARFSNDELKTDRRKFIETNDTLEPRTWRTSPGDGDRIDALTGNVQALPKTVGGGCLHADLKMPRFDPVDFQLGTTLTVPNASFADWPIQYTELEPFYAWGERLLGVQGRRGANPFEGPRSTDYPIPPGTASYGSTVVGRGLAQLGYTMFPYPTAVNSIPYDGRPACVNCGFCSGYPCPTNAKGSTAVTMLRKALLSGNCQLHAETRVVKLVTNATKTAITSVSAIDPSGTPVSFTADRYVLAASPIEDARLLFLSDPAGLGNSSGMVGRNLMFHYQTIALGIFEERVHGYRGRTVDSGFADFRGVPNDPNRPLGGIVEISGGGLPLQEAAFYARILNQLRAGRWDGPMFKSLMRQSPGRDRVMILVVQAEDAPQATNRIDLDPAIVDLDGLPVARCTYNNHAFEVDAGKFYEPKLMDILQAAGARYTAIAPRDAVPQSQHIMGTLRSGTSATTSVTDKDGKFWDIGNLFASDGSLFPTSSGYNPTMTIVTLALRVAAAMINPTSPSSVIT